MKFKIMPAQSERWPQYRPESPPAPPEPVLLFKLEEYAAGIVVTAQLEGSSKGEARYILTISEKGIRRCSRAEDSGLPVDEAGRVVDCTGGE